MELVTGTEKYLNSGLLPFYYSFVLLCTLYVLYKFKFKKEAIFITLLFSEGILGYLSYHNYLISNLYKIGFVVFAVWLYGNSLFRGKKSKIEKRILFAFVLIGIAFIISDYLHSTNLLTTLSQYLKKYGIPFLFLFGIKNLFQSENKVNWYVDLFITLLTVQILYQFLKWIFFGFGESIVGSINFQGGASGNIIPILAFLLIWIKKKDKLNNYDWTFIILLFLSMAIIGNKRSVWFTMLFMIFFVKFYVSHSLKIITIFKVFPVIILFFVVGVKSNPTLNPEHSRWGTFDIEYVFNYTSNYTFGTNNENEDIAVGRGGATIFYLFNFEQIGTLSDLIFGFGLEEVVIQDYENFDLEKFRVQSKGSTGAFVQNLISLGLLGTIAIFLFGVNIVNIVKNKKFRLGLLLFLIFDYFLFYNSTITINANAILFIFICYYFNFKFFDKTSNENVQEKLIDKSLSKT